MDRPTKVDAVFLSAVTGYACRRTPEATLPISPNTGLFTWFELLTPDPEAAKAFYGRVVGWGSMPYPDGGMPYTLWTNARGPVGGMMKLADVGALGDRAQWLGTVSVVDVDDTVARALAAGGTVVAPAHDVPKVGRFAVLADPTGARVSVMQPSDPAPPLDPRELGRMSWCELWTSEPDVAWAFYRDLFGWVEAGSMEMAPGERYRMFGRDAATAFGGIARKAPEGPPSAWLYYATVESADRAGEVARGLGAQIFVGPMDVPGGGRIVGGIDPQGAGFAVFSAVAPA